MDENQQWHLMKYEDGSIFGPVNFKQLHAWAQEAQVSPLDKVSTDEANWVKAPMIVEMEMDYLIHVSEDQYYGPTTLGAVREFLNAGEITPDTQLTNCKNGTELTIRDVPELCPDGLDEAPLRTSIRVSLQARVRELEESLLEERRARELAESRCIRLQARLMELGVQL